MALLTHGGAVMAGYLSWAKRCQPEAGSRAGQMERLENDVGVGIVMEPAEDFFHKTVQF